MNKHAYANAYIKLLCLWFRELSEGLEILVKIIYENESREEHKVLRII